MAHDQVLVLNVSYEPLGLIHWHRAICLVFAEKVTVEATEAGRFLRSARAEYPYPAVIRLRCYVRAGGIRAMGSTRSSILRRDGHRCAYRGSSPVCVTRATSVDHVLPRSRGGGDDPANLVAACLPCNQLKGDRTPEEIGWVARPWASEGEAAGAVFHGVDVPEVWRPFLPSAA